MKQLIEYLKFAVLGVLITACAIGLASLIMALSSMLHISTWAITAVSVLVVSLLTGSLVKDTYNNNAGINQLIIEKEAFENMALGLAEYAKHLETVCEEAGLLEDAVEEFERVIEDDI